MISFMRRGSLQYLWLIGTGLRPSGSEILSTGFLQGGLGENHVLSYCHLSVVIDDLDIAGTVLLPDKADASRDIIRKAGGLFSFCSWGQAIISLSFIFLFHPFNGHGHSGGPDPHLPGNLLQGNPWFPVRSTCSKMSAHRLERVGYRTRTSSNSVVG
jgi:hypothetical protein